MKIFSKEITEQVLGQLSLPTGGIYTSVGTYDSGKMQDLVTKLSELTSIPANNL